SRLRRAMSMFRASENWVRTPPAARDVEPAPSEPRSTKTTSTPASARWKAALVPITPPPTITTSADAGNGADIRGMTRIYRRRRCGSRSGPRAHLLELGHDLLGERPHRPADLLVALPDVMPGRVQVDAEVGVPSNLAADGVGVAEGDVLEHLLDL